MNNSKKSFFNVKLYLEGIRQLKIVGIMGAIIMAGAAFLIPLGINISNANNESYIDGQWVLAPRVGNYVFIELNPFIVTTFLILTPLMVLILFHFLNRRNACDFYHAIPDTRTSLFISYGSAVITWNAAILLLSYLITAISDLIFKYVTVDYSDAFVVFINCIAGCVFMFGVFAIAMSLTGTLFSNFAVGVMILAVPRTIVTVFVSMLVFSVEVLPFNFNGSILDDRLNVVTNMVTGLVIRNDVNGIFMWKSTVYTFIVGIIYCILGLILFCKRKSEAAASAAVNAKFQCAIRLLPAIMVSLIPLALLIDSRLHGYEMEAVEYFIIVVLYLIAVLAYFIYELITTRKLRNLLKAAPGLLWLFVFNVVFYGLFFASYYAVLNDVPKTAGVKYVNITSFNQSYRYNEYNGYYSDMMKDVDIESEEVKELLLSELQRNVNLIKENKSVWDYADLQPLSSLSYLQGTNRLLVEFHTGFGTMTRFVFVSPQKMNELLEMLQKDERVTEIVYEPVPLENITSYGYSGSEMTKEEIYEIYLAYLEDLKNMDREEVLYKVLMNSHYSSEVKHLQLTVNNNFMISFSVGPDTPNALLAFLKLSNAKSGEKTNLLKDMLNSDIWKKKSKYEYYNIGIELRVFPADDVYNSFSISGDAELVMEGDEAVLYDSDRYNLTSAAMREKLSDIAVRIDGKDNITDKVSGNVLYICYRENYMLKDEQEDVATGQIRYYIIDDETMKLLKEMY